MGVESATDVALERLASSTVDGFFIHLDADCLDDDLMPAVDYRLPGGLSWEELTSVLSRAVGSGRAAGLEVTIYNPVLDKDGAAGRKLTDVLAAALGTGAPSAAHGSRPRRQTSI